MRNQKQNFISTLPVPLELIERRIYLIRGQKVMLSFNLAEIYQVETRTLIQSVQRNIDRFPEDFMFQLSEQEYLNLKSQIVISSWGGARRANPYAFTEQGVAMLSSVLSSKRAIAVNIAIMRAFVKLREVMSKNKTVVKEIEKLETGQKRLQLDVAVIFHVINQLIKEKSQPKSRIGFRT